MRCPRAEGAAIATGAKLEWHDDGKPYLSYLPNTVLGGVVRANMEALGRMVEQADEVYGSTDFGNVSQVIPTAYAQFGICGEEMGWHSREVAAATKSERGHAALIAAAKTLAMSTLDLLGAPNLISPGPSRSIRRRPGLLLAVQHMVSAEMRAVTIALVPRAATHYSAS